MLKKENSLTIIQKRFISAQIIENCVFQPTFILPWSVFWLLDHYYKFYMVFLFFNLFLSSLVNFWSATNETRHVTFNWRPINMWQRSVMTTCVNTLTAFRMMNFSELTWCTYNADGCFVEINLGEILNVLSLSLHQNSLYLDLDRVLDEYGAPMYCSRVRHYKKSKFPPVISYLYPLSFKRQC